MAENFIRAWPVVSAIWMVAGFLMIIGTLVSVHKTLERIADDVRKIRERQNG